MQPRATVATMAVVVACWLTPQELSRAVVAAQTSEQGAWAWARAPSDRTQPSSVRGPPEAQQAVPCCSLPRQCTLHDDFCRLPSRPVPERGALRPVRPRLRRTPGRRLLLPALPGRHGPQQRRDGLRPMPTRPVRPGGLLLTGLTCVQGPLRSHACSFGRVVSCSFRSAEDGGGCKAGS